jgi:hypothetical protein
MNLFRLDWPVYAPYRIERRLRHDGLLRHTDGLQDYVVRDTDRQPHVKQPFKGRGLCRELACCKTPADALGFVNNWGFLHVPDAEFEAVADVLAGARLARSFVAITDRRDWPLLANALTKIQTDAEEGSLSAIGGLGGLGVQISVAAGATRPELWLRPANLLHGILVQHVEEVTREAKLRPCEAPGCPHYFEYGPGTKKRETAHYCSVKCKDAHAYDKRKQKLREARS